MTARDTHYKSTYSANDKRKLQKESPVSTTENDALPSAFFYRNISCLLRLRGRARQRQAQERGRSWTETLRLQALSYRPFLDSSRTFICNIRIIPRALSLICVLLWKQWGKYINSRVYRVQPASCGHIIYMCLSRRNCLTFSSPAGVRHSLHSFLIEKIRRHAPHLFIKIYSLLCSGQSLPQFRFVYYQS